MIAGIYNIQKVYVLLANIGNVGLLLERTLHPMSKMFDSPIFIYACTFIHTIMTLLIIPHRLFHKRNFVGLVHHIAIVHGSDTHDMNQIHLSYQEVSIGL